MQALRHQGSLPCVGRIKGLIGVHVKNVAARSCFAQSGSRILLIRSQDICCYNWAPSGACRLVLRKPHHGGESGGFRQFNFRTLSGFWADV